MGSLATPYFTLLFLFPVGVHRFISSTSLYLRNPSSYRSKPWFFSQPRWKNLELYALILALPLASLTDLIIFTSSSKLALLQQSMVYFLFWMLLILILIHEFSDTQIINETSIFLLAGIFFIVEYFLNGEGFTGVSRNLYDSLGHLSLICGCSCLYLSVNPNAFFADFFLSIGLVFKATWGMQCGLTLYTDVFGLKGCSRASVWPGQVKVDVKCDLQEDRLRGIALMDLMFVVHSIAVFAVAFGVLLLMSYKMNLKFEVGDFGGPLLTQIDSERLLRTDVTELEME